MAKIKTRTLEQVKKGIKCIISQDNGDCDEHYTCHSCSCFVPEQGSIEGVMEDGLAAIEQLEEEKKQLQKKISNQRRQLQLLHVMYEWALRRLQKAYLNDRANFQAFLRERGYDLATMELPVSKCLQLERERNAAIEDARGVCKACIHFNGHYSPGEIMSCCKFEECIHGADDYDSEDHWQWRGVQETDQ